LHRIWASVFTDLTDFETFDILAEEKQGAGADGEIGDESLLHFVVVNFVAHLDPLKLRVLLINRILELKIAKTFFNFYLQKMLFLKTV
jgi:hypothetical protein